MTSNEEVVLRGDKKCPHGYTKRAACTTCDHEDDLKEKDAEIERLTEERDTLSLNLLVQQHKFEGSYIQLIEAERDRLRAALERIAALAVDDSSLEGHTPEYCVLMDVGDLAREVLRGADTSSGAPAGAGTTLVRETSRSSGQGPERPVAWFRFEHEREPPIIAWGDWPPPVPDDTVWNPLYSTPNGRPAVEPGESHE